MNTNLKKALDELSVLPDSLQNQIAENLLEEIRWKRESYESSKLSKLSSKAIEEHKQGKTHEIGFDEI